MLTDRISFQRNSVPNTQKCLLIQIPTSIIIHSANISIQGPQMPNQGLEQFKAGLPYVTVYYLLYKHKLRSLLFQTSYF